MFGSMRLSVWVYWTYIVQGQGQDFFFLLARSGRLSAKDNKKSYETSQVHSK